MNNIVEGLTFNDVLLVPQYSDIVSRKPLNIGTRLTKNIHLNMPIISSNMDTVTEDKMAIAMASSGGIGIIHRFISVDDQVAMVKKVKRYMNYKISNPYCITIDNKKSLPTVQDYENLAKQKGVRGFPVVDSNQKLLGMVTNRDLLFASSNDKLNDIMTPVQKLTVEQEGVSLEKAYDIMKQHKIEKLPLVNNFNDMILTSLVTVKDILHYKEINRVSTVDSMGRLMVGAAVGVKDEDLDRAKALVDVGVDILCVDVAHGHNILCGNMVKKLKSNFPDIDVIAGNVATAEGTKYLIDAGADCIKVSIGSGSICTTRMVTGCGVPQLTALFDCVSIANKYDIPIISDGGNGGFIGNIVKALASGASTVMLGNFLAGTDESPGPVLVKDNKRVKLVRGMSGYGANLSRRQNIESREDLSDVVPEGVDAYVPYKGPVKDVLTQICGGIKSGMSYNGAHNLIELVKNSKFIKITDAGRQNSNHHGVNKL
jgi:IMP dehydrogenase